MGTDIVGWIEVDVPAQPGYPNDPWAGWTPVIRITDLVERNYGMFGSLFGVRNDYHFRPIAPDRGQPSDLSAELEEWSEIPVPPWDWAPSWITWGDLRAMNWEEPGDVPPEGIHTGIRRRDVLSPGWRTTLDLMERLAQQFGEAGVRMSVWFF
ncbi:MAG TPA: hypothetical protein VGP82_14525 [Ktedonobacterales bacterium]|jgi:hypothetical protein|nr:hypothetical protein [Ktedonobacterales bacterium]